MTSHTLRDASSDDLDFCFHVYRTAFRPYAEPVRGWDDEVERHRMAQRLASQTFRIIVVSGEDVGYVAAVRYPEHVKLNQLFILPEHQGHGIGSSVIGQFLEKSTAARLSVFLKVIHGNDRALAFYRRHGFRPLGTTDTHTQLIWP